MNNEVRKLVNLYIGNTSRFYQFQVVKTHYNEDDYIDNPSNKKSTNYKLIEAQTKIKERYQLLLGSNNVYQADNGFKLYGEDRLLTILRTLGLVLAENGTIHIPNHFLVNTETGNNSQVSNSLTFTTNNHLLSNLKKQIKQELKKFDSDFQIIYGRTPSKTDKEPLKPLYLLYKQLKDSASQVRESTIQDSTSELELLKQKKNQLREFLETYQNEFFNENHRKVLYHKDLLPIEKEYLEYKSIKNKIKQLEGLYSSSR
ncbi:uncharacterized protein cubi_03381 [Cryptosporidium ubiquitum]|uniref:FAM13A-like domain-containing protein n=1 Tax=Cryptosporidium ubiquitum TaxID=857276 RepID=A0A1J4MHU2_9CRYT|nr:uncharacterized protein cubi_03381 [Cryptosporidium ubiquitum]OII73583.1 hypothetical protein cubi_03381 [Cryptosporidium ubiquitum]